MLHTVCRQLLLLKKKIMPLRRFFCKTVTEESPSDIAVRSGNDARNLYAYTYNQGQLWGWKHETGLHTVKLSHCKLFGETSNSLLCDMRTHFPLPQHSMIIQKKSLLHSSMAILVVLHIVCLYCDWYYWCASSAGRSWKGVLQRESRLPGPLRFSSVVTA